MMGEMHRLPTTTVCRAGGHGPAIAEYALMAMLASSHAVVASDQSLREGRWDYRGMYRRPLRRELSDCAVGVIGYGEIGQAIAQLVRPFCRRLVALSRSQPQNLAVDAWYPSTALHEFLPQCDFVVVCLPLNDETRGLIGARELSWLQRSAILINVGRAPVIDQTALVEALQEDRIGGAVLDVWWHYPTMPQDIVQPAEAPFRSLDNLILTPHISGWTENTLKRRWDIIMNNIRAVLHHEGQPTGVVRWGETPGSAYARL